MSGATAHPPYFANAAVIAIDVADIFVPERIGFLHEDKAVALGRLIAVDGQRDPIKVAPRKGKTPPWQLVTGRHRLRGCEIEGMQVFAIEVQGKPEDLADLEASENLHRRPLGPIERAKFTAALVQAAQERIAREHGGLSQQKLAIKARWERVKDLKDTAEKALNEECDDTQAKLDRVYSWHEAVADALNMGRSNIKRALRLYRLLIEPFPEYMEALSKHPVVGNSDSQLRDIADFGEAGDLAPRRRLIEAILADPELSVPAAKELIGARDASKGPTPVAYEKHLSAVEGNWFRLSLEVRNRYVREKLSTLLTPSQKRDLRDALVSELGESPAAPPKVGVAQAAATLSETIRIMSALIDGEGVDDEQLGQLRRRAQEVVFDIPESGE